MANETTGTTVTELINSEWIRDAVNFAAKGRAVAARYALPVDMRGKAAGTVSFPQEVSDVGSPDDYDLANETTDLSNTAWETQDVTLTPAEYGIQRTITMTASEDNILGEVGLFNRIVESGAQDMAIVLDDDVCALLASFATTVGTSGSDLTLANMAQAVAELSGNEMPNDGGAVFILDKQQATDYAAALAASTATTLASFFTKPEEANGLADGFWGTWMGAPIFSTSLTDTANGGADVAGALYLRGDEGRNPLSAALAVATKRDITIKVDEDIGLRSMEVVLTQRKGGVEMIDLSGVSVITDA